MVTTAPAQPTPVTPPAAVPEQASLLAACRQAASHLYDAEVALHHAHQSHVDAWVTAAYDKLHEAIAAHTLSAAALARSTGGPQ